VKTLQGNQTSGVRPRRRLLASILLLAVIKCVAPGPAAAAADTRGSRPLATKESALTTDSEAYRRTRDLLPDSFKNYETRRFVVLSNASPKWTRTQLGRLERTAHQLERFARRLDLRPQPLGHKLVCVLFADRDEYRLFASAHDEVTDTWIAGYYAPRSDRVVFYHAEANPSVVEARAALAEMNADIDSLDRAALRARKLGQADRAKQIQTHRRRYEHHVRAEGRRIDAFAEEVGLATTVHEAVHQLLFNTGIQTSAVQSPFWISEGLATAFETSSTQGAFGPDHEYEPRRGVFDDMLAAEALIDLRMLVSWTELPTDDADVVQIAYHESYALVTWMSRFRRSELREYIHALRAEPAGAISANRHAALFTKSFGDVATLERAWLRHERSGLEMRLTAGDVAAD